jgi:hypothetical protein
VNVDGRSRRPACNEAPTRSDISISGARAEPGRLLGETPVPLRQGCSGPTDSVAQLGKRLPQCVWFRAPSSDPGGQGGPPAGRPPPGVSEGTELRPFSPPFEKSASSCGHRRGLSLTIAMDRANYLPRSRGSAPLGRWLVESRFRVRQGKTPPLGAGTLFPNGSWKKSRRRAHPMIELPSGECSPGSVPMRSVTPWRGRARRPGYRFSLRMTFATAMPR